MQAISRLDLVIVAEARSDGMTIAPLQDFGHGSRPKVQRCVEMPFQGWYDSYTQFTVGA